MSIFEKFPQHGEPIAGIRANDGDNNIDRMVCIVDGHHGVYVPQVFVSREDINQWGGATDVLKCIDWQDLLDGPENENYWESWLAVLDNAYMIDGAGYTWTLHQGESGDLFMVRDDFEAESL